MAEDEGHLMRILHLVKTSAGATWALRQMRELVKLGLEIHVALPPGGRLVSEYEGAGIIVHPLQFDFPIHRVWRCRSVFDSLRRLMAEIKPDIIHSHFVGTTLTMRLALGKTHPVPRIFQVPGPLHLEHPFFRQAEIFLSGNPDYWIGSCRWTCKRYRQSGVSNDRLFLSYYGTDVDNFSGRTPGKLRKEFGFDAASKVIGMVAYMYPPKRYLGQTRGIKGHEDLIDAIGISLKGEPKIKGVFIGGAWDGARAYERRVRAYGERKCRDRIVFLGTRNDVLELYPDLDVVVHPSRSENVGGAAESLLLAMPTIATNVGGLPDLVKHNETGWLVPPREPNQLAETILMVLEGPAEAREIALKGQVLARSLLDVRQTACQVATIYQKIIASHCA